MRAAVYARVSSEDQRESGTIATQVDYARRYCELNGIDIVEWYLDDGVSGTIPMHQRPQGQRLLAAAKDRAFDVVLVYRVDRLARRLKVLLDGYESLEATGIGLRSMTEPIDSTSPMGRFVFQLLGSIAELERETIIERTKAGRRRAAREGRFVSGRTPFGYVRVNQRLEVDNVPIEGIALSPAEIVALCYRLVADDHRSANEVADRLNAMNVPLWHQRNGATVNSYGRWSDSRVRRLLHLSTYCGDSVHGDVTITVPTIVDREMWRRASEQLAANQWIRGGGNAKHQYLLRGLLRCDHCGMRYVGESRKERQPRYRCQGHARYVGPQPGCCHAAIVAAAEMDGAVWKQVCRMVEHSEEWLAETYEEMTTRSDDRDAVQRESQVIEAAITAKAKEKDIVARLARSGRLTIEDAETQLDEIAVETRQLATRREALFAKLSEAVSAEKEYLDTLALVARLRANLASDDTSVKRETIEAMIREIRVHTEWSGHNGRYRTGRTVTLRLYPCYGPPPPPITVRKSGGAVES